MNLGCGKWAAECADVRRADHVREIGFGSGALIAHLAAIATTGRVAGVDPSPVTLRQARRRNVPAIARGEVELRAAVAEQLPFGDASSIR